MLALLASGLLPSVASSTVTRRTRPAFRPQLGIAVIFDAQNRLDDAQAGAQAVTLFRYIKSLHANAVSLNFPFYMASSTSNVPKAASFTPSPGRMAEITAIARQFGLSVQFRPFLSEPNLKDASRSLIHPSNLALWFANYWQFLQPYLVAAKQAGAASFSIAMENASLLSDLKGWLPLVRKSEATFGDQIYYSSNHVPYETVPMTKFGYDAYQPIPLKSDSQATVANLTAGFEANLATIGFALQPADTTLEEVSILAVSGAYRQPNVFRYRPGTRVDRMIQANWFTAACNAVWHFHMAGIYYWSVSAAWFSPTRDDAHDPGEWINTASQHAIAACFSRTR